MNISRKGEEKMTSFQSTVDEMNEYSYIIKNALSIELRVDISKVDHIVEIMEDLGFKGKNSWASMQLSDHTVIEFWKKELIKS